MNIKISKSKIFLICCISFIIGIAIFSFLENLFIKNSFLYFICTTVCTIFLIFFWKNKKIKLILLILLFLFLGIWRYAIDIPKNTPDKIWSYNGKILTVIGIICNEPDIRQGKAKLEIKTTSIVNINKKISGKLLITTNEYPSYNYGDKLEIKCELKTPERFNNFSYDRYLGRFNIYSVCYYPKINLLDTEKGNWFYAKIFNLKKGLHEIINKGLNEPESSLASAIILGYKKNIPLELQENFSKAGISHIIAISGMHISILSALVMAFLLIIGIKRNKVFWLSSLALIIYIILIGLPASAMRAGLMGFLILLAMSLGRLNKINNSIIFSAAALLFINPKLLRGDIGFQLSFLAVLGIIYFYPAINYFLKIERLSKISKNFLKIFIITISAQIFATPILATNFSQISIISPISNLLILWTLPILMIAILFGIILSLALPNISLLLFIPASFILKYITTITKLLIKIPYSSIEINYLNPIFIIFYYIIIIWIIIKFNKKQKYEKISKD